MDIIKWRDTYETGITGMDEQHRQLVELINRMYPMVRDREGLEELDTVLAEMESYAERHLQDEEQLLAEHGYPGLADQEHSHQEYRQKMIELKELLAGDRQQAAREIYHFLRKWLIEHIIDEDKPYGLYLRDKGVR